MAGPEQILAFWFGRMPMTPEELDRRMPLWFGALPDDERRQRDDEIRTRFGPLIEQAAAGGLAAWTAEPRGRLALVIVLDQLPRNVHRGTARAFAYDDQALGVALEGIEAGADAALDPVERLFFHLPLQHAESLAMQDRAVAAYRRLLASAPASLHAAFERALRYAEEHRTIIERFGRFPHRNRVLGRASTPEERAYLRTADTFGQ